MYDINQRKFTVYSNEIIIC